jgi:hypothetical protein
VTFRTWDRVLYLLAVGFASCIYVLKATVANAAWSPSGEWMEGSAQQIKLPRKELLGTDHQCEMSATQECQKTILIA